MLTVWVWFYFLSLIYSLSVCVSEGATFWYPLIWGSGWHINSLVCPHCFLFYWGIKLNSLPFVILGCGPVKGQFPTWYLAYLLMTSSELAFHLVGHETVRSASMDLNYWFSLLSWRVVREGLAGCTAVLYSQQPWPCGCIPAPAVNLGLIPAYLERMLWEWNELR